MYEHVRMTLDYMKNQLHLTIKECEINMRIKNKFSIRANPKISEHQLVLVKRSSLFQVWANEECVQTVGTVTAKEITSRNKKKPRGRKKNLTAKRKDSLRKKKLHGKKKKTHGKRKKPHGKKNNFTAKVKDSRLKK